MLRDVTTTFCHELIDKLIQTRKTDYVRLSTVHSIAYFPSILRAKIPLHLHLCVIDYWIITLGGILC